jgi:hypothetical protein
VKAEEGQQQKGQQPEEDGAPPGSRYLKNKGQA